MGNSGSGGVYVATDKTTYAPGEMVSGTLYGNILNPVHAKSVSVRVSGKERCHWTESQTRTVNGKSETHSVTHSGFNRVLDTLVPLVTLDASSPFSGQFQYPFSFVLPVNIPGSHESVTNGIRASVIYKLTSRVNISGMFKSDLVFKQVFFVRQPPPFLNRLQSCYSGNVTVFCCVSRGFVTMNVSSDKNAYTSGEQASVMASIDNQSRRKFRRIIAELVMMLDVYSSSGRHRSTKRVICATSYPGVAPMSSETDRPMTLPIPQNLSQNCQGTIVRMHYVLNVRADVAWGTDPKCFLPIMIYLPETKTPVTLPTAPPDYKPAKHDDVSFGVIPAGSAPPQFSLDTYPNVVQIPIDPARDVVHVAPSQHTMFEQPMNPISNGSGPQDFIRHNN